jgi:hypothetical protein
MTRFATKVAAKVTRMDNLLPSQSLPEVSLAEALLSKSAIHKVVAPKVGPATKTCFCCDSLDQSENHDTLTCRHS